MIIRQIMANPSNEGELIQLRSDLAAIMRINSQYAQRTTAEHIKNFSRSGAGVCLVAEEDGAVVGFLLMAVTPAGAAIIDVETNTDHLGTEVTRRLIEKAHEFAFLKGVQQLYKIRV